MPALFKLIGGLRPAGPAATPASPIPIHQTP